MTFDYKGEWNECDWSLLSTRRRHLSHHYAQHGNPASNVPRKIDLKIWWRWVAGKISRSITFGLFLIEISQGKGLPQQANIYHPIEGSYWRRNSIDWTGNADQSHEQLPSSCKNLCAIRGTLFEIHHFLEVVVKNSIISGFYIAYDIKITNISPPRFLALTFMAFHCLENMSFGFRLQQIEESPTTTQLHVSHCNCKQLN